MAEIKAVIGIEVKGDSKIKRLISSANQLQGVLDNLNKTPFELNVSKYNTQLNSIAEKLSALEIRTNNSQKAFDDSVNSLEKYSSELVNLQSKLEKLNPGTKAYNTILEKQEKAAENLAKAKSNLAKAEAQLDSIQSKRQSIESTTKSIEQAKKVSEAFNALADDYISLGKAQQRGVQGQALKTQLNPTIAQLNAQAEALQLIANNSRIASGAFNRFVIASQVAGQQKFKAKQKQLEAIAFGLSESAPRVEMGATGSIAGARNQVQELINLYPGIVKSEAALSLYSEELRRLQSLLPYTSKEFSVLENAIAEVNNEIANIGLRGQKSAIFLPKPPKEIKLGPASPREGTLKDRQKYVNDVNEELARQKDLLDQVNKSSLAIADKEQLSLQLSRARNDLEEHRLEIARKARIDVGREFVLAKRADKAQMLGPAIALGGGGEVKERQKVAKEEERLIGLTNSARVAFAETQKRIASSLEAQMISEEQQNRLLLNLDGARLAIEEKRLTVARTIIAEVDRTRKSEEAANRARQGAVTEEERKVAKQWRMGGGPALPPGGVFAPGEGEKALRSTLLSSQIIEQALLKAQKGGLDVTKDLARLRGAITTASSDDYQITRLNVKALSDANTEAAKRLRLTQAIAANQKQAASKSATFGILGVDFFPVTGKLPGGAVVPGSPASKRTGGVYKTGQSSPITGGKSVEGAVRSLQILEKELLNAQNNKLDVSKELASVQDAIASAETDNFQNVRKTLASLLEVTDVARDRLKLAKLNAEAEKSAAVRAKAVRSDVRSAIDLPRRAAAFGRTAGYVEESLQKLGEKNVDTSEERARIQGILNSLKENELNLSNQLLDDLREQLKISQDFIRLKKLSFSEGGKPKEFAPALTAAEAQKRISEVVTDFNKAIGAPAAGIGENASSSLAFGLKEGIPAVVSASNKLGIAIEKALKKALGIASPSRVMIEIARNLVTTYISYLESATPIIEAASKKAFGGEFNFPQASFRRLSNDPARIQALSELVSSSLASGFGSTPSVDRIFELIQKKGSYLDVSKVPGINYENASSDMAKGKFYSEDVQKIGRAYAEFYNISSDLAPILKESSNAASASDVELRQLLQEVGKIAAGLEEIKGVFAFASKLASSLGLSVPKSAAGSLDVVSDYWLESAKNAKELAGEVHKSFSGPGASSTNAIVDFWDSTASVSEKIVEDINRSSKASMQVQSGSGGGRPPIPPVPPASSGGGSTGGRGGAGATGGAPGGGPSEVPAPRGGIVGGIEEELRRLGPISQATTANLDRLVEQFSEIRASIAPTTAGFDRLTNEIQRLNREQQSRDINANFLTRRTRDPRIANAISEGLIGGAFPALFGQGAGASVGGGLGGALGGFAGGGLGFGLSLIGTAAGQAIDAFINNIKALGQSLKDPTASLEAMKTAGLAVSDSLEYNVKKLQDAGKAYEAQSLVFAELKKQLGPDAVKQVQALTAEQKQLDQEWQQLTSTLTSKLLPIATGFIAVINDIVSAMKVVTSIKLPPWVQETIDIGIPGMKSVRNIAGALGARGRAEAAKQSGTPGLTPEAIIAQKSAAGATDELRAQVQLASQQLTLAGMTAEKDGARYASLAKAVAIQEYENKLLEIKNSWIGQVFNREQNLLKIRAANLELSAKIKNIDLEVINAQTKQGEDAENKRIEALKTINSLYVELNNLSLEKQDLENEITGFLDGETAKLERQLKLMDDTLKYKEANLLFEAQTALQGAKTAEEQRLLNEIYSKRMNILQRQESLEAERVRRRLKEVELEKQLAVYARADETAGLRRSLREQQAKTAIGISSFFAMPGETDAANLALEQRTRRAEGELEIMGKIRDITAEINSGSLDKEALATKQLDLQAQQQKLGALYEELTILEQLENQQLKLQKFFASYGQLITGISDQIANSVTFGISEITAGTKTAQQVFADFLSSVANILMQTAQQMIATYISIGIAKMFAGMGSNMGGSNYFDPKTGLGVAGPNFGLSNGGVFNGNGSGISTFANGGMFTNSIVKSPTLFRFADGAALRSGVMGEAGPEAVMPLTRGSDGRLGVDASGLGSGTGVAVTVNVDAKGTQVQGNDQQGNQLGRAISAAVQQELIKQQRPGGLLAAR